VSSGNSFERRASQTLQLSSIRLSIPLFLFAARCV
jgi:hypothetical protein